MVEHIFALAVGLEIGGRGGDQCAPLVLDQDRRGRPAGARADAARIFERGEEGVAEERIAAGERVPCARRRAPPRPTRVCATISVSRSAIGFPDERVGVNLRLAALLGGVRIVQL